MTVRPDHEALDASLLAQESKSLLRLVACGSVDHGKSSLLGRLLYESRSVFDDQLETLASDTARHDPNAEGLDFSLLLDGLAAEREQKITIDVAYRFFSTAKRKFILADAPGHEQYTRNMATGASTADAAILLIDVRSGLTSQTKRHSLIVSALGVRHLVVAVNKMDLADWSQDSFAAVEREFRAFAKSLTVDEIVFIPLSARHGDNVVSRSTNMEWYRGPALLDHLEQVEIPARAAGQPFRIQVQWVNRPDADFRGYCGMIASGEVTVGQEVRILPSGVHGRIARIVTGNGDIARAIAGQSVTLVLEGDADISRGDVIAGIERAPLVTDRLRARIVWMGQEAFAPGKRYLVKAGTCAATATVGSTLSLVDLDTQAAHAAERLFPNEIGVAELALDRPIAVDRYADNRETGSIILIDSETYDTVGLGLVEGTPADRNGVSRVLIPKTEESHIRSIVKAISWRGTGSLDTFVLSFLITGSSVFAGSIAVTEIVTKIVLYYCHERVWSIIPWGRSQRV
jgi:sulfate adenylyltransferase large subunit